MSLEPMYLLTVFVVAICAGLGWSIGVSIGARLARIKFEKRVE